MPGSGYVVVVVGVVVDGLTTFGADLPFLPDFLGLTIPEDAKMAAH